MAQARSSGSRLVMGAVAGTLGVVGLSTIYLPFFADRDTIRGLHEEEAPPTSHMLVQEIRKLQEEGILKGDDAEEKQPEVKKAKSAGSSIARAKDWYRKLWKFNDGPSGHLPQYVH